MPLRRFQFSTRRMLLAVLFVCIGAAGLGWAIRGRTEAAMDASSVDGWTLALVYMSLGFIGALGAALGTLSRRNFQETLKSAAVAVLVAMGIMMGGAFVWHFFLQID